MFFNERKYCDLRKIKLYEFSARKIQRVYVHTARKLVECGNSCALTEDFLPIF